MIALNDLYRFMEGSYDFLLTVDQTETILHASPLLQSVSGYRLPSLEGQVLERTLTEASVESFRWSMVNSRQGLRTVAVYSHRVNPWLSLPLRTGFADLTTGGIFLFCGSQIDGLGRITDAERNERTKELSCLYSVAEWMEMSPSIREFFNRLPDILSRGMQFPDQTVVYSIYQGEYFGSAKMSDEHISVSIIVNGEVRGEIRVGYISGELHLLPEEYKLLNGISRMLSISLERKELAERLARKQTEESESFKYLCELERNIEARTKELEEQRTRINVADSYLERVSKGLKESTARLETMFHAIPDDVALIDTERNLIMTNKKGVLPKQKCHQAFFNRDLPCQDCRLSRIVKEKTPVTVTIHNEHKYYEVSAFPCYGEQHNVDGIIEYYRDITLEKTYELQIYQADKLVSLGQLVSGIGHEINNPNQFIRGNIKIIRQAFDDILPIIDDYYSRNRDLMVARLKYDFFRRHILNLIDDVRHGSERIKNIVDGLRSYARRDEGLLVDMVDINEQIRSAVRLVHNEVHRRAEVKLDLCPDLPLFAGNSHKVEQILVNLIVNAAQAIKVDVRGVITLSTRFNKWFVVVSVYDNGIGMSEKTMKQIFDPFFTTKRGRGGTGLGLFIVHRIVQEHKGTISVTSSEYGSTFTLRFPVMSNNEKTGTEND
ncbi:MAG: GHKL domain-containing protein [Chitinispirillaceae bacterium]|nr:GHKL domain-containing protein [Chitinispirillaceae bacterium]